MNRQLAGRIDRAGQTNGWLLKVMAYVGFAGLSASVLVNLLLPGEVAGWQLLLLGGSLIPAGAAHALSDVKERGARSRLLTGALASCGGALLLVATLAVGPA